MSAESSQGERIPFQVLADMRVNAYTAINDATHQLSASGISRRLFSIPEVAATITFDNGDPPRTHPAIAALNAYSRGKMPLVEAAEALRPLKAQLKAAVNRMNRLTDPDEKSVVDIDEAIELMAAVGAIINSAETLKDLENMQSATTNEKNTNIQKGGMGRGFNP